MKKRICMLVLAVALLFSGITLGEGDAPRSDATGHDCAGADSIPKASIRDYFLVYPTATPSPRPATLPPAFGKSGSIGFMGDTFVTYQYSGTTSDVADYILALVDAGYQMVEQKVDDISITMTFRNDEEDIELEILQILPSFSGTSTILITYDSVCPDGYLIDGKIVKQPPSLSGSDKSPKATASPTAKPASKAPSVAVPNVSYRCGYCSDRKICPVCNGRRRYYISGYGVGQGSYVDCAGCNGTGRCPYCG